LTDTPTADITAEQLVPEGPQVGPHMLTNLDAPLAMAVELMKNPQGTNVVVLRLETVVGSLVFGWPTEKAAEWAQHIVELAAEHPNSGLVTPNGNQQGLIVPTVG